LSHPVLEGLRSADPAGRLAACRAAVDDPSGTLLIDALGEALADPVREVSRAAGDALVALGRLDRSVDEVLRRALRSQDTGRRFGAAAALARLAPPGPMLIPALVEALGQRDGDVRWTAARLLVDAGRLHPEVLGILLGLARGDERPPVRRMAVFALRELAPDLPECARTLVQSTHDDDTSVRRAALTAMASLLDPPAFVLERLLEVLGDDAHADPASRRIATLAFGELGATDPACLPAGSIEQLQALAASSLDAGLRRGATRALARLGLGTQQTPSSSLRPNAQADLPPRKH
jgi:HEAT repeat protein